MSASEKKDRRDKRRKKTREKTPAILELQGEVYVPDNSPGEQKYTETIADPALYIDSMAGTEHCEEGLERTIINKPRFARKKKKRPRWKSEWLRDLLFALAAVGVIILLYVIGRIAQIF